MIETETRGFLSTEFNTRTISEIVAELGSQVKGLKDTANENAMDKNTYSNRIATTLVMC